MPLPLRHLNLLRPGSLPEPMPKPAYHVRCSGKQDFHFKFVEEKVFWLSAPICYPCCGVVFVKRQCLLC